MASPPQTSGLGYLFWSAVASADLNMIPYQSDLAPALPFQPGPCIGDQDMRFHGQVFGLGGGSGTGAAVDVRVGISQPVWEFGGGSGEQR